MPLIRCPCLLPFSCTVWTGLVCPLTPAPGQTLRPVPPFSAEATKQTTIHCPCEILSLQWGLGPIIFFFCEVPTSYHLSLTQNFFWYVYISVCCLFSKEVVFDFWESHFECRDELQNMGSPGVTFWYFLEGSLITFFLVVFYAVASYFVHADRKREENVMSGNKKEKILLLEVWVICPKGIIFSYSIYFKNQIT